MEAPEITRASVRDFLNIIFKRQYQILLFFIITFAAIAVGTLLTKPTYEAKAQVLVNLGSESIFMPATGSGSLVLGINREEQINSEIEILKSRSLAKAVVNLLGPATIYPDLDNRKHGVQASMLSASDDPASPVEKALLALQKKLDIQAIKKSNVIEISFKHKDPQMAATVANTLANLYLDRHVDTLKTPHSHEFFRQQSEFLEKRLNQAEARLKALKQQYNVTALDEQQKFLLQRVHDLRMTLHQTESEAVGLENRIQLLGKHLAAIRNTNPTYQRLRGELLGNRVDLKALKAKSETQGVQLAEYRRELEELNQIEVKYNQLQQDVDVNRQNYRLYLTKLEESRISNAMDSEKITGVNLIEPARVPLKPVSPKVFLNLVLGLFLGALGGLGLTFFLHYLDNSLETVEDVEHALDVPVLISVPYDKKEGA
jgi:uncharacterized protein involved in exopolysaccharide biosynthesis